MGPVFYETTLQLFFCLGHVSVWAVPVAAASIITSSAAAGFFAFIVRHFKSCKSWAKVGVVKVEI